MHAVFVIFYITFLWGFRESDSEEEDEEDGDGSSDSFIARDSEEETRKLPFYIAPLIFWIWAL